MEKYKNENKRLLEKIRRKEKEGKEREEKAEEEERRKRNARNERDRETRKRGSGEVLSIPRGKFSHTRYQYFVRREYRAPV